MVENYLDIGHDGTHSIWLWHYDDKLECLKTVTGEHEFRAISSGRVDPVKRLGSITFSPQLPPIEQKIVINSLIARFPGVKFYVFADDPIPVQEYYEQI